MTEIAILISGLVVFLMISKWVDKEIASVSTRAAVVEVRATVIKKVQEKEIVKSIMVNPVDNTGFSNMIKYICQEDYFWSPIGLIRIKFLVWLCDCLSCEINGRKITDAQYTFSMFCMLIDTDSVVECIQKSDDTLFEEHPWSPELEIRTNRVNYTGPKIILIDSEEKLIIDRVISWSYEKYFHTIRNETRNTQPFMAKVKYHNIDIVKDYRDANRLGAGSSSTCQVN